jgi:hypothetical protein
MGFARLEQGLRHEILESVLTPTVDQHVANTEFITLADSLRIGEKGYIFGRTRKRTGDTACLEKLAGKPLATLSTSMTAGSGVLFQPASVLHRGITPTTGTRYTITLCLLPSTIAWRQALDKGFLLDLEKTTSGPVTHLK